ncbi:MAG: tetratricopeptide repeat protein [Flavobacteriales bacterium]|nr:tetratricopeptide repeat protein [Flavobacteriales bacterium]
MNKGQILLIVGAVVVTAGLYMLPYAPLAPEVSEEEAATPVAEYSVVDDVTEVNNGLDSASLAVITRFEIAVDRHGKTEYRDSLMAVYDMLRQPLASAYHSMKKAEAVNTADAWTEAGERFLLNAKYMGDQRQKAGWFGLSKLCLEKALALAPNDLDIKVDLGVCMVESAGLTGDAPMQGIGLLKEVEQADPNNVKALINLGYFSVRSGQFDKAEERFIRALKADPDYSEAYLYLADLYEKQQQTAKAIDALNTYMNRVDDPQRKAEVAGYIKELSNKLK